MVEKNLKIKHHNCISESVHYYSAKELNLLCYLIANINEKNEEIKIETTYIREFMNLKRKSYKEFENLLSNLGSKALLIKKDDLRKKYYIFSVLSFKDKDEFVYIKLNSEIQEFFLNLKSNFTLYTLEEFINLNKLSSKKLYQLINRNKFNKVSFNFKIELNDFKEMFNIETKAFDRVNNIMLKIIKPAIEEINEKTNYSMRVETIKSGKNIIAYNFFVSEENNISQEFRIAINYAKKNIYISKSNVLNDKNINKLLKMYEEDFLIKALKYLYKKINNDFNSFSYIKKIIDSVK